MYMAVSSRGSLDTACISNVSPDLMLRWDFLAELDSPAPYKSSLRSHGSFHRAVGVELGLADKVVVATPGPDLTEAT